MIKIKNFLIKFYIKYKLLSETSKKIFKKCIKLLTNVLYILILYIYMPDMLINNANMDDNDKMLFMACFIIFSTVMSYILQNYQCKPPESINDSGYNVDINTIETEGSAGAG
jgi:hypothetical protein